MKLYEEKELADFLYDMYVNFGQFSVIDFVRSRQEHGQLTQVVWDNCDGCDDYLPTLDKACLVCGGSTDRRGQ